MEHFVPYKNGENCQFPQILAIFVASLTGISDGMLFAWTSPSIPTLTDDNSTNVTITLAETSYFTMISSFSMVLTAPLFSMLVDQIGRRRGVLCVAIPQLIAWILTILAKRSIWIYYIARFFAGTGDAIFFATTPIYVCEIAEPSVRGSWGNVLAVSIYVGIFLVNVIGAYCDIITTAAICGTLPIITVVLFWFMPDSPFFFLMNGKEKPGRKALQALRWRNDVDEELATLRADVKRQTSERGNMKELFTIASNRKALIMCIGIRIAQQLSGLSAFEMYTQSFFKVAGGSVPEKTSTIIFAGILTIMVVAAAHLVEKFGRKPLMYVSCAGCGVILAVETVYFALDQFTDIDMSRVGWLPLTGMLAYIVLCATGIGILPTLIMGEIFSASIKGKASAIMNAVTGVCLLVIPKFFLSLTDNFGIYSPFAFFSACCFGGVVFTHFCVIETKGKTLEEIQQELRGKKGKQLPSNIECNTFLMHDIEKI